MSGNKTIWLFLAAAGTEMSWLFAAAGLLISHFGNPSVLLLYAPFAFFLGAGLTRLLRQSNQRVITRLGLHLILLAALLYLAMLFSGYRGEAFWSREWLGTLAQGNPSFAPVLRWAATAMVTMLFWSGGILLARRSLDHLSTALRFDAGVAAFVIIFIIAGVTGIPARPATLLLFPFFLFSMLAIALARRQQGDVKGGFLEKYRSSGPILTFAITVLLGGSAVLLLFYPLLTRAAEGGYAAMQHYGPQLADMLAALLRLLFGFGRRLNRTPPAENSSDSLFFDPAVVPIREPNFWELLLGWVGMFVLGTVLLLLLAFGLFDLLRWLWSGKNGVEGQRRILPDLFDYFGRWWRRLQLMKGLVLRCLSLRRRGSGNTGSYFFTRLLHWGQYSGLARQLAETPYEYSRHLIGYFPSLRSEIALILACYQDEAYGGIALEKDRQVRLHHAWRRLSSPRCWPARLHFRLIRSIYGKVNIKY